MLLRRLLNCELLRFWKLHEALDDKVRPESILIKLISGPSWALEEGSKGRHNGGLQNLQTDHPMATLTSTIPLKLCFFVLRLNREAHNV